MYASRPYEAGSAECGPQEVVQSSAAKREFFDFDSSKQMESANSDYDYPIFKEGMLKDDKELLNINTMFVHSEHKQAIPGEPLLSDSDANNNLSYLRGTEVN